MNKFEVYVWIDGEDFDAEAFQPSLEAHVSGTAKTRKRMRNGTVEQWGTYWQSEVRTPVEEKPEEALAALLVHYRATILRARALQATREFRMGARRLGARCHGWPGRVTGR